MRELRRRVGKAVVRLRGGLLRIPRGRMLHTVRLLLAGGAAVLNLDAMEAAVIGTGLRRAMVQATDEAMVQAMAAVPVQVMEAVRVRN